VRANPQAAAWCVYLFLRTVPAATQPPQTGNSQSGFTFITGELFPKLAEHVATTEEFIALLQAHNDYTLLYSLLKEAPVSQPWVIECLRRWSSRPNAITLFQPDSVIERWKMLQDGFPEVDFNALMTRLVTDSALVNTVCEGEFNHGQVGLYSVIVRNGGTRHSEFPD